MTISKILLVTIMLVLFSVCPNVVNARAAKDTSTDVQVLDNSRLTHAYYLFRSGNIEGCEDCYIPLILSSISLSDIQGEQPLGSVTEVPVQTIVTYERDSIWEISANLITITDIDTQARTLRMDEVKYRYQEVPLQEAVRLLEKPLGSIPISRPLLPNHPTIEKIQSLLKRLQSHEQILK